MLVTVKMFLNKNLHVVEMLKTTYKRRGELL